MNIIQLFMQYTSTIFTFFRSSTARPRQQSDFDQESQESRDSGYASNANNAASHDLNLPIDIDMAASRPLATSSPRPFPVIELSTESDDSDAEMEFNADVNNNEIGFENEAMFPERDSINPTDDEDDDEREENDSEQPDNLPDQVQISADPQSVTAGDHKPKSVVSVESFLMPSNPVSAGQPMDQNDGNSRAGAPILVPVPLPAPRQHCDLGHGDQGSLPVPLFRIMRANPGSWGRAAIANHLTQHLPMDLSLARLQGHAGQHVPWDMPAQAQPQGPQNAPYDLSVASVLNQPAGAGVNNNANANATAGVNSYLPVQPQNQAQATQHSPLDLTIACLIRQSADANGNCKKRLRCEMEAASGQSGDQDGPLPSVEDALTAMEAESEAKRQRNMEAGRAADYDSDDDDLFG